MAAWEGETSQSTVCAEGGVTYRSVEGSLEWLIEAGIA
jgi:hypothetical protein